MIESNINDNNDVQTIARSNLSCNSMVAMAANRTIINDNHIHPMKYNENIKTFREVNVDSSKQLTQCMSTVSSASKLTYPIDTQHYHHHQHQHWSHLSQAQSHGHNHNHHHQQASSLLSVGPGDNHLSNLDYFQSNYTQNVQDYHQPYVNYHNNHSNSNIDPTYQTETIQNNCYLYPQHYNQNQLNSSGPTNYSVPHGHNQSSAVNYLTHIDQSSQLEQNNFYYNSTSEDNQQMTAPEYAGSLTYNNPSGSHLLARQSDQYPLIPLNTDTNKYYHNYSQASAGCGSQSTASIVQEHVQTEQSLKAKPSRPPESTTIPSWTANGQRAEADRSVGLLELAEKHLDELKDSPDTIKLSVDNVNSKNSTRPNEEATHQRTKQTVDNQSKSSSKSSIKSSNQCHVCGRNYARPSTLKTHLRTHTNERPFKCNVCFKTFSQAANLTAHQRVHTGERPFSCPICGRQFSQSSSVITHLRTHSGERPYKCNMCSRTFSDSSTLTKHCRIHSGEKPYQCDYCPLNFSQSGNLSRHLKLHLMGSLQASSSASNSSSSSSSSSSISSSSSSSSSSTHSMLTVN